MALEPSLLEDAGERYPPEHRVDLPRIERAVREILVAVGEDPDRVGPRDTPARVARAYEFLFAGLGVDPIQQLTVDFQEDHHEMVHVRDIPFYSTCEHHLLPLIGKAHVGYIPDGKVVGLSKLARVVEGYSRRPRLQERLTAQVADALHGSLGAQGVIVVVEADHLPLHDGQGRPEAGQHDRYERRVRHLRQGPTHPPGGDEPYNRPTLTK
jgi:GTP cyclohydrolase IA